MSAVNIGLEFVALISAVALGLECRDGDIGLRAIVYGLASIACAVVSRL